MLEEQVAWEQECLERGVSRYKGTQDRLREKGQGERLDAVKYLLKQRMRGIAKRIHTLAYKNRGGNSAYNKMLQKLTVDEDYLKVAYIGTQTVFQSLTSKKPATLLSICLKVSKRLEADLKCQMFAAEYPGYYHTIMRSFKDDNVEGYDHKHNVLMKKFKDFDIEWEDWTPAMKVQVGGKIVRCVMKEFWDVLYINKKRGKGVKTISVMEATPEFDKWIHTFEQERGFLLPELLPLKIPPAPWTSQTEGGYYTPQMRAALPFVKTKSRQHEKFVLSNPPLKHMQAVNKLQETAWQVNTEVLEVQRKIYEHNLGIGIPSTKSLVVPEFPEHLKGNKSLYTDDMKSQLLEWKTTAKKVHTDEMRRKGQLMAFMQAQRLAMDLADWDKFYFAYNCDFRGRVYCATPGLSPQGADNAKGLLRFAESVPLGESGVRWLAIHGANTYGMDKCSFDDRVKWVHASRQLIEAIAEDAIGNSHLWADADKPYQFLAFCFEWKKCNYGKNISTLSNLPVGIDGSCNGLQHFSAMLLDDVGARATNLSPAELPEDIYQQVADRCIERLKAIDSPYARRWLKVGVTRKCTKRPVMTLPYGATQQSCRAYIMDYVTENWAKFELPERYKWEFAKYLTPVLWASIGDVVVAARKAMKWLQQNIGNRLVHWVTPVGFPVFQCYKDVESTRVETQICGVITLFYSDYDKEGEPNKYLQRSGISPNFVHSLDSAHMVMTILNSDFTSYAMIHDDFGTHAGKVEELSKIVRQSFYNLYDQHCPLTEWAEQNEVEAPIPEKGEYNLIDIIEADYFFS